MNHWPPLYPKRIALFSLPHLENDRQWSVNDCWPSIMVNHCAMWPLWSIYIVLPAFVPLKAQEYLVVAL